MKKISMWVMAAALAFTANHVKAQWLLTGNTIAAGNFLGTVNSQPLDFKTVNTQRMRIDVNGRVGIGTLPTSFAFDILTGSNAGQLPPSFRFNRSDGSNQSNALILGFSSSSFPSTPIGGGSAAFMLTNPLGISDMAFSTNTNAAQMILKPSGNVGINTTSPLQKLHVHNGGILISGATPGFGGPQLIFSDNLTTHPNGRWAIEYMTATATRPNMGGLNFWTPFNSGGSGTAGNYTLFLKDNGKIGMGVTDDNTDAKFCATALDGNHRLYVNGGILTTGITVANYCSLTWPDYVFENQYKLRPLAEVEAFIKQNKHLPNIPSGKEIEEKGLNLATMQSLQMEKIEELTLYLIEMKKEIETLKKENAALKLSALPSKN
jgi:hypothetical protein